MKPLLFITLLVLCSCGREAAPEPQNGALLDPSAPAMDSSYTDPQNVKPVEGLL